MVPLQLYLIRHGIAVERQQSREDTERPLTLKGRKQTSLVAKRLRQLDLKFDLLLTSPLLRARQTAEIFQSEHLSSCLEISATLAPWGDFGDWLTWLEQWRQAERTSLGLVGHQPDLGEWAEILVWGEAKGGLALKKTGMLGITLPEAGSPIGNSLLFWLTQPRLLL